MGKIKKKGDRAPRPGPLPSDIERGLHVLSKPSHAAGSDAEGDGETEEFLSPAMSKRILRQAMEQRMEEETEVEDSAATERALFPDDKSAATTSLGDDATLPAVSAEYAELAAKEEQAIVSEEDQRALSLFFQPAGAPLRTIADVIAQKLAEKRGELEERMSSVYGTTQMRDLDERLVEMYEGVRDVLAKYRSGALPKAFKIIPKLVNWEQIITITTPATWTPAAMYQATRLFASNLNERMAQRFFNLVLLPRVRDDLEEYKKLNPHLYMACRKAMFKPGAFFKGVVLPMVESGCTLREAVIMSSLLRRCSVPMLHAAAAMMRLAEYPIDEWSGAVSIFLRILIEKKYTLPYQTIDALVNHFVRFLSYRRGTLPVLWHQALLALVQRYKTDLSDDQRQQLLEVLRTHSHYMITPEIRRELLHAEAVANDSADAEATKKESAYMAHDNPDMMT